MNFKATKITYWTSTLLISAWFGASGFFELTNNPLVWQITQQLGYPAHFIYLLGVFKVAGVSVLLAPNRFLRLKEWVFAGIFFDIVFAFVSKISVLGLSAATDAVIAFAIASTSYAMFRKLYPVKYGKTVSK
ncbi:DoxX family protein [Flavobacterium sp. MAH-1]|uniref:DoxX family protein n=1 Tax=Flavobacterium agri TaxID=2743471 RepID=A0A7Y8Y1N4_9FLAO|nr:DoxX family protein [Flavobacterium agri]NUY79535.1 DoxX family protein [Flavobacterium agri]NYA69560.1 DoxX family protein [Flavobacterium agri]